MDVEFNGTFFVNDEYDDDYAGFVFNYQSNKRFIVVSWKKTNETYSARTPFVSRAMSGIQIKVNSNCCECEQDDNLLNHFAGS